MGPENDANAAISPPRVRYFELGGWPALGDSVLRVHLGMRTVFVGRNGAGKSALLDGAFLGFRSPFRKSSHESPHHFECEVGGDDSFAVHFRCHWDWLPAVPEKSAGADPELAKSWEEWCWTSSFDRPLWTMAAGKLNLPGAKEQGQLAFPVSLLEVARTNIDVLKGTPEALPLLHICDNLQRVRAGVPRETNQRGELFLRMRTVQGRRVWSPLASTMTRLANPQIGLMRWFEDKDPRFEEFVGLGQRLKLFQNVRVQTYGGSGEPEGEFAAIYFDEVNGGLLSDGTLRIVEILSRLLQTPAGAMLIIEEPETAVHPGLLKSLLNIIDSYSVDRQIVYSTHSPTVLDHVSPADLRLVRRVGGNTDVRALSKPESRRVSKYLEDEGTLGEFLFESDVSADE